MINDNRKIGIIGENVCAHYLSKLGYKILRRNWYCHWGEIDIIASKDTQLIFIEVKTITAKNFCSAKELFNHKKRQHLLRTINYFLFRQKKKYDWRLDLVCITKDGRRLWIEHYKNVLAL